MNMNTSVKLPTLILIGAIVLGLGIFAVANMGSDDSVSAARYGHSEQSYEDRDGRRGRGMMNSAERMGEEHPSENRIYEEIMNSPAGDLTKEAEDALRAAIDDEYKAQAVYDSVMDEIGGVRPFSRIIEAEGSHISALASLFDKYDIPVPADPYGSLDVADNKADNCAIGVQAEIDNAALYRENLLPVVEDFPDITSVFTKLMDASQEKHLPAFERCSS